MRHRPDTFDEAFSILMRPDSFDHAFAIACKINREWRDTTLWGPEVVLFSAMLKQKWNELTQNIIRSLLAAFDVSGEVATVDKKKVKVLRKLLKTATNRFWEVTEPEATVLFELIQQNALAHCRSQQGRKKIRVKKQTAALTEEGWQAYLRRASLEHLRGYLEDFDGNVVSPELDRMVRIALNNPRIGTVDRADLEKRLIAFEDKVGYSLHDMADIQVGRAWNWTALELAHQRGVKNYQIIAELDNRTCSVCTSLHGKTFPVDTIYASVEEEIDENRPVAFPTFEDVDNKAPEVVAELGFHPPFHPHCRCEMVLAWTKLNIATDEEARVESQVSMAPITEQLSLFPDMRITELADAKRAMDLAQDAVDNLPWGTSVYTDKLNQTVTTYAAHDELLEKKAIWIDLHDPQDRKDLRHDIVMTMLRQSSLVTAPDDVKQKIYKGFEFVPTRILLDLQRNGLEVVWDSWYDGGEFNDITGVITIGRYTGIGGIRGAMSHELAHAIDCMWSNGSRAIKSFNRMKNFSAWDDPLHGVTPADGTKFRELFKNQCSTPLGQHNIFGDPRYRGYDGTWLEDYDGRNYHSLGDFVGEEFFSNNAKRMALSLDEADLFDQEVGRLLSKIETAKVQGNNSVTYTALSEDIAKALGGWARGDLTYGEARLECVLNSDYWKQVKSVYPDLAFQFETKWFKSVFDDVKNMTQAPERERPILKDMIVELTVSSGRLVTTVSGGGVV